MTNEEFMRRAAKIVADGEAKIDEKIKEFKRDVAASYGKWLRAEKRKIWALIAGDFTKWMSEHPMATAADIACEIGHLHAKYLLNTNESEN